MATDTTRTRRVYYPESDGKPVGESDVHRNEILFTIAALDEYFRQDRLLYVSGNLMFYYEEGNPKAVVSPDIFVVKGVEKRLRRIYKLWDEGQAPCLVVEVSSRSTRREDLNKKKLLYARLGVEEYVLFDPLREYLVPALQGFRLQQGEYTSIAVEADGALLSDTLGLRLVHEGHSLAVFDAASGARLLRPLELAAARRAAEEQMRAEEQARRAAEEQMRAEEQARRAAELRAATLESQLQQLRAEIERLKGDV